MLVKMFALARVDQDKRDDTEFYSLFSTISSAVERALLQERRQYVFVSMLACMDGGTKCGVYQTDSTFLSPIQLRANYEEKKNVFAFK